MMYIETAIKSISLECIMSSADSESIQEMYNKIVSSYKNAPPNSSTEEKKKLQQNKLNLQSAVQSYLGKAYKNNNTKIVHWFINTYMLWKIWGMLLHIMMSFLIPDFEE